MSHFFYFFSVLTLKKTFLGFQNNPSVEHPIVSQPTVDNGAPFSTLLQPSQKINSDPSLNKKKSRQKNQKKYSPPLSKNKSVTSPNKIS